MTALKTTLYVGGLDRQAKEDDLYAAFIPFGPIKEVQIPKSHTTQANRYFGFVEYEYEEDALAAIDNMDDSELFGRTLRVTKAKSQRPNLGSNTAVWNQADTLMQEDSNTITEQKE